MLMVKGCPRCKGDMFVDRDQYGSYEQCIQCGHMRALVTVVTAEQHPTSWEKGERPDMDCEKQ